MESGVQIESQAIPNNIYGSPHSQSADRLVAMEYINTIGKRFVAAFDRFHVHRALLEALQELYSFSACCILLKGDPFDLFVIPCYPLNGLFLESMIQRIAGAANRLDFQPVTPEQLARSAYFDAPDILTQNRALGTIASTTIGSCVNIPLTVEDRIIGILSLFDEKQGTFDTNSLKLTAMIADYAAVALDNVRLRERENALWREAELERMRLELIIGSMAEGLLITDAKGAITSLNKSAEQLLAQAQTAFTPGIPLQTLAETSKVPWLPSLVKIINQALSGQTVKSQELVAGKDDERVPLTLSISAAPLYEGNEFTHQPIGVVSVLNDITSSKQVERLKDDFVSVVSHELRTPLTAIKGYTQHLVRRIERRSRKIRETTNTPLSELPETNDLHSLAIIQSQTEHLERLVSDLLDLSQVQWGKIELHYETFQMADLLNDMVRSVQASAEQHMLTLDIQSTETQVTADRTRLGQVIGNILDNAIKYSPHGGQVNIRLQGQNNSIYHISIKDQGVGVNPEHFEHIFERFYRVHNTASQHYAGIGLGLYVAKAIIHRHGGHIWLENNQGTGSTFHFTVPAVPPSENIQKTDTSQE